MNLVNVNRLSPEEMKHHEAMMERKFKQDNVVVEEEDEKEISVSSKQHNSYFYVYSGAFFRLMTVCCQLLTEVVRVKQKL